MELDTKVICFIITLGIYEYLVKRSLIPFSKWAMFVLSTIYGYASISFNIKDVSTATKYYTILISSIIIGTLFFTNLYTIARSSYYTLPPYIKKKMVYTYGIVIVVCIGYFALQKWSPFLKGSIIDPQTGAHILILNHEMIGSLIELIVIIFGVYAIILNWFYVRKLKR